MKAAEIAKLPTPETDDLAFFITADDIGAEVVPVIHFRALERKLAEAVKRGDFWRKQASEWDERADALLTNQPYETGWIRGVAKETK